MSDQTADSLTAQAALAAELEQVEQEMRSALADLRPPFSQLVQAQLRRSFPLHCAAFVLTAGGAAGGAGDAQDGQKRIDLAAAIEVLRLALAVHTQLLDTAPLGADRTPPDRAPVDRSLLGSTVLAGDYCFSRSAALAARTGSPAVVDIFAQALQRVSESTLRGLFRGGERTGENAGQSAGARSSSSAGSFEVERELSLAGVLAAGELAGIDEAERQADRQAALLLLDVGQGGSLRQWVPPADWPPVSPPRRARWLALADWLAAV